MAGLKRIARSAVPFLLPTLILGTWEGFARAQIVSDFLLPPLSGVLIRLFEDVVSGELVYAIALTVRRTLAAFGLAAVCGVTIGALLARSRLARWFFDPLVSVGLPTPKIVFLPIFVLWFGFFETSKILMAAFNAVFPIIAATWAGARSVDKFVLWSATSMGARPLAQLTQVVLPAASPAIFTGLQIGLPISLIITIVTEMATGGAGLGGTMIMAMRLADAQGVFAGLICTALVGHALLKVMSLIRTRALRWHQESAV